MCVAAAIRPMPCPEPTKERVEGTTLDITPIEIPHSTRFIWILWFKFLKFKSNLKNLNHFTAIWKRLKVTVWGRLPWSRYANTTLS